MTKACTQDMSAIPMLVPQELRNGRYRLHTTDCIHAEDVPAWWFPLGWTDEMLRRMLAVYPHVELCDLCSPLITSSDTA